MNLQVHNMLDYGDNISLNINDALASGIGHCGDYSFLLSYMLREKGYDASMVGIKSIYMLAPHAVVECNIEENKYVFDPTDGVYYENSIEELINDPKLSNNHILQVDENECIDTYVCEDFWRGVQILEKYYCFITTDVQNSSFVKTSYYNRIENSSVTGMVFNGEVYDILPLLDGYVISNLHLNGNQNNNEIIISLQKNNYSMICVNFSFDDYSLQDISLSVHDTVRDEWIPVDSFGRFGSFYEIYLNDYTIDALKINGSNSPTGEIVISDILVTEEIKFKMGE